ncbi:MAG: hypothetical protein BWY07_00898 [Candidatus Hydrogenedentes bacterium ADurb.Bin170]|jgi:hypothetical protein|nr:MAG: hypothetical protein BWY07_00898 [Candidatus Hydrogenedentes bacterium ADurb.Bin170]
MTKGEELTEKSVNDGGRGANIQKQHGIFPATLTVVHGILLLYNKRNVLLLRQTADRYRPRRRKTI